MDLANQITHKRFTKKWNILELEYLSLPLLRSERGGVGECTTTRSTGNVDVSPFAL